MPGIIIIISKLVNMGLFFGMCWFIWITKVKDSALASMAQQELLTEELYAQDRYLQKEILHQKNNLVAHESESAILQKKFDLWLALAHDQKLSKQNNQTIVQKKIEARANTQRILFAKQQYIAHVIPNIISCVKTDLQKLVTSQKIGISVLQTIIDQLENKSI